MNHSKKRDKECEKVREDLGRETVRYRLLFVGPRKFQCRVHTVPFLHSLPKNYLLFPFLNSNPYKSIKTFLNHNNIKHRKRIEITRDLKILESGRETVRFQISAVSSSPSKIETTNRSDGNPNSWFSFLVMSFKKCSYKQIKVNYFCKKVPG